MASLSKVKALLETTSQDTEDDWSRLQEMMSILRMANPAKLRARNYFTGSGSTQ